MSDITYAPATTVEIMTRGMDCLVREMGVVDAEYFIATVKRENFDYTKWHQEYFAKDETLESFLQKASDYAEQKKK